VRGDIVHHHDLAGLELRTQHVFQIGPENVAVGGARLAGPKTARGGKNAAFRAGSKDGGSVYTESDREVQNGNSGLTGK
jgi:hypothetical protein